MKLLLQVWLQLAQCLFFWYQVLPSLAQHLDSRQLWPSAAQGVSASSETTSQSQMCSPLSTQAPLSHMKLLLQVWLQLAQCLFFWKQALPALAQHLDSRQFWPSAAQGLSASSETTSQSQMCSPLSTQAPFSHMKLLLQVWLQLAQYL